MEKLSYTAGIYVLVCKTLCISSDFEGEIFKNFPGKYIPGPPRTQLARRKLYCLGKYFLPIDCTPYFEEQLSQANKQRNIFFVKLS